MSLVHCPTPVAPEILEDYWLADLSPSDEEAVEQHLLACDECSGRLRVVIGLAEGIRAVARGGTLRVVVTDAFLDRLAQEGLRVREYRVTPGGRVACTVTAEDDLVVGRFVAPLEGVERLDLAQYDAEGRERQRFRDLPFDPMAGEVLFTARSDVLRTLPATVQRYRLIAVRAGGEDVLGEYTFAHTPSGEA
jgi:hypothetical protein